MAARAACLEVEMDFLEREAEYKRLVMLKEIAKAKAEEEVMRTYNRRRRREFVRGLEIRNLNSRC